MASSESKVDCIEFNDRVYTVGSGLHSGTDVTDQQQQHEHSETSQQVIVTAADDSSLTAGLSSMSAVGVTSATTSHTDLITRTSWARGQALQTSTAWACPANVQLGRAPCEAASLAQQIISHNPVASQHLNDDKLMFEDGLSHLRSLYESQLASSRSVCETRCLCCLLLLVATLRYLLHSVKYPSVHQKLKNERPKKIKTLV